MMGEVKPFAGKSPLRMKRCETCFFWLRVRDPVHYDHGWCRLIERQMFYRDDCAHWEAPVAAQEAQVLPFAPKEVTGPLLEVTELKK